MGEAGIRPVPPGDVRPMSDSQLAIAGFYDHQQENDRRAPDWGGDALFASAAPRRRRFERSQSPTRLRETHEHPLPARPEPHGAAPAPAPPADERYLEPVPAGRRTVTITGRPEGVAVA